MTAKSNPSTLFLSSLTSPGSEVIPPPYSHGQTFTHRRQITQWPWNSSSAPLFGPNSVHLCCLAWIWEFPSMLSLRTTKHQSFQRVSRNPENNILCFVALICQTLVAYRSLATLGISHFIEADSMKWGRGSSFKLLLCFIYLISLKD